MSTDFHTVEQISEMLNIHPKTIQRYIREGRLRAVKVGKGWRVSGHDLSAFLEANGARGDDGKAERTVKVSSVIDILVYCVEDAVRVMNLLTSAFNARPPELSRASAHSQYIERERMVRVTLWGEARFVSLMIDMIDTIAKE